jgi:hypothetical protein
MSLQFELPDGRNIDYYVSDVKDGFPILWFHGMPGAFTLLPGLLASCEKKRNKAYNTFEAVIWRLDKEEGETDSRWRDGYPSSY